MCQNTCLRVYSSIYSLVCSFNRAFIHYLFSYLAWHVLVFINWLLILFIIVIVLGYGWYPRLFRSWGGSPGKRGRAGHLCDCDVPGDQNDDEQPQLSCDFFRHESSKVSIKLSAVITLGRWLLRKCVKDQTALGEYNSTTSRRLPGPVNFVFVSPTSRDNWNGWFLISFFLFINIHTRIKPSFSSIIFNSYIHTKHPCHKASWQMLLVVKTLNPNPQTLTLNPNYTLNRRHNV